MQGKFELIDFSAAGNLSEFEYSGFSVPERDGVWSNGPSSSLLLKCSESAAIKVEIDLLPFVPPSQDYDQSISVAVNDHVIGEFRISRQTNLIFSISPEIVGVQGDLKCVFHYKNCFSPKELNLSADPRLLAFKFRKLSIQQAGGDLALSSRECTNTDLFICAIIKNEEKYILEWLEFHRKIGVDRFFLYDNESTDATGDIVRSWPFRDMVHLISWNRFPRQNSAYQDMIANHASSEAWCAFIDCDEFLCPRSALLPKQVLRALPESVTGLYVHWLMFGSSHHLTGTQDAVTRRFQRRARSDFGPNRYGKTIARLNRCVGVELGHLIRTTGQTINDSGAVVDTHGSGADTPASHQMLSLNHYFTKSLAEWTERRSLGRVSKNPDDPAFFRSLEEYQLHDVNEVFDDRICQVIGSLGGG